MQMLDRLAGILTAVGNNAVATGKTRVCRDPRNRLENARPIGAVFAIHFISRRNMSLGNDQNVYRRLWGDIVKCIDRIILIRFIRGNVPRYDLAKKTVCHHINLRIFIYILII